MKRAIPLGALALACLVAATLTPATAADRSAPIVVRGSLDIVQEDDFDTGRTRRHARLIETGSGRVFHLEFGVAGPPAALLHGASAVARGNLRDDALLVGADDDGAVEVVSESAAAVTGSRSSIVIVVDFSDSAVTCSDASISSLMYGATQSVDAMFRSSSRGQLWLPADTDNDGQSDVFRVSIPNSVSESCDAYGWAAAAEAALPPWVDLGLYRHRVIVLPNDIGCGWAGLGNVGCGSYCRAWVKTCHLGDVYGHEIGHNLGMAHASTDGNNDGAPDCEYCDRSDPMGYGGVGWRNLNGAHEEQMGWLPASQIVEVGGSGTATHVISRLYEDPAAAPYPQVLKIAKADSGDFYYLTYRTRQGFDAGMDGSYADRTNIHRYAGSGYNNTLFIKALLDGETFEDTVNGFTVTQLSHDSDGVTVQIGTECVALSPSVSISPASQMGQPGASVDYTVTVTNNDPAMCGGSAFDLFPSLPAGWSGGVVPGSMTLEPGAQGQATLSVVSDPGSADGTQTSTVIVSDALESTHGGSADADYVVDGTAPAAVSDLAAAIKRKTQVELTWSAPFEAGSGISGYNVYRDGAPLDSTGSTTYVDRATSSGETYEYSVTTVDGVGNESAPSNPATITVGSGGGGGGGKGGGGGGPKEVCDDGVDNDADGLTDCDDSDCRRNKACR